MTGLKSGSGDDLWGDDGDDEEEETSNADAATSDSTDETENSRALGQEAEAADRTSDESSGQSTDDEDGGVAQAESSTRSSATADDASTDQSTTADAESALDASSVDVGTSSGGQPYIVRRAVQDKSVQFERDERLTFFVHDDVADGERDLITDLESALGRDLPKFDVREAVYRAALRNPEAVLEELLAMGYSVDEE